MLRCVPNCALFRRYRRTRLPRVPLHVAPDADGLRTIVERHIGVGEKFTGGDIAI